MDEKVKRGDVLAGKYRVERVLGSGGMGIVVAARHEQLDVLVALKFMTDQALQDEELVERFLREARAAARLRSEHVARVTDVGRLESGAPYQVIEYLEGCDLAALLANEGPLPVSVAVDYIVQACDAIDEAHRAGIIHRDIKPSNLFRAMRPNGRPCIKVLDFGISKSNRASESSTKLHGTQSGAVLGSPFYMAPEQMRSAREVDARADIWALGATLYELLTSHVPFEAESLLELALQIAQSDPRPPRELRAEIPWVLEQVILRCLEKNPRDRLSSARLLARALGPFALHRGAEFHGVASRAEWNANTSIDSSEATATRVVGAPSRVETAERAGQSPLEAALSDLPEQPIRKEPQVPESKASVPKADAAVPMLVAVQGSLPPTARSAPPGWRTGGRVSWGRSQRSSGTNSRALWGVVVLGTFGGAATALLLRSTVLSGSSQATGLRASMTRTPGSGPSAAPPGRPPLTAATEEQRSHIPTVSVTDLPAVSPQPRMPPATPSISPPAPAIHLAPARGLSNGPPELVASAATHPNCIEPFFTEGGVKKFRLECLERWESATTTAASARAPLAELKMAEGKDYHDAAPPTRTRIQLERDDPWPPTP
jgi:serine/threonine-protein kinase